jgi:hypothetical protein
MQEQRYQWRILPDLSYWKEKKMVKVICEMTQCIYYIHKPEDGEAYQHQCGNDEIEIGYGGQSASGDVAKCYTFEEKE